MRNDGRTMVIAASPAADPFDEGDHSDALTETGFWGRAAAGCLILASSTGRILIAHRSEEVLEPNTWGTWGGAIDPSEPPSAAVCREVSEETGYEGNVEIVPLYVFEKGNFRYSNFLAIVYEEFEPNLNWESQGSGWFSFAAWPDPLHFGLRALFDDEASLAIIEREASLCGPHPAAPGV